MAVPSHTSLHSIIMTTFLIPKNYLSIMIWNVQGAGSRSFQYTLKELIHKYDPTIVALVEIKISGQQAEEVCAKIGFESQFRIEAQGFSGGIWLFWKSQLVQVQIIDSDNQFVSMEVTVNNLPTWIFTAVYASPHETLRRSFWHQMNVFSEQNSQPWLLAGDFNETRNMSERKNCSTDLLRRCSLFEKWIDDNAFIDLGFTGPPFTWSRGLNPETKKCARLDRGLCNQEWRLLFEEAGVHHLLQNQSDHCPILIAPYGFISLKHTLKPFRFQAAWFTHDSFKNYLQENWRRDSPLYPQLLHFSDELIKWNREVFGNLFYRKKQLWSRIEGIQQKLAHEQNRFLITLESRLRKELDEVLDQIEILWFQKARTEAIRDGDRNTRYYHLSTIIRRWMNIIETLQNQYGEWYSEDESIKSMVRDFFKALYTDESISYTPYIVPANGFPRLSTEDMDSLARPFTGNDIRKAIFDMDAFKAPGPDGYPALFFQKQLDLTGSQVTQVALNILQGKEFPEGVNETFLVLIPKVENPQSVTQLRPIGLCNVVYKAITKSIVNRIKPVLAKLIAPTQSSFVPGRQITDNIIIVQEMLHSMRRKKGSKGFMAIKIDLEKAYDRLRWPFIRETLLEARIPQMMIDVILNCISLTTFSILWHGEKTEAFTPSRGVRQGDPLSPYLFVLCMERLNHLIEAAVEKGDWKPIIASRGGPSVASLFFADDLILFGEASLAQARTIKNCLDTFCKASGQKVSYSKSSVFFSNNVEDNLARIISEELEIPRTNDLGRYLGMPTLHNRVTKQTFARLSERVNKRLSGWKAKLLSSAGRLTLIQSTLSSIPYFAMQTAKLPRSLCDELDRKNRSFLWGGNAEQRKIHHVNWATITKSKDYGGLGLRSMRQANTAFSMKLGWRVLTEKDSLWSRILRSKYCKGRCDMNMFQEKTNVSNVWRGILDSANYLRQGLRMEVGNGQQTLFWHHHWVLNKPLSQLVLSEIPTQIKDLPVSDFWDDENGWKWDLFSELLPEETLKAIASYTVTVGDENNDEFIWDGSAHGGFSVKSALAIIRNEAPETNEGLWRLIWRLKIPQRMRFFIWLVAHDRLMTNSHRVKRRLATDPNCRICIHEEEDSLHILRDCRLAQEIWSNLIPIDLRDNFYTSPLQAWLRRNLTTETPSIWPTMFTSTTWWLWKWRNRRCFDDSNFKPSNPSSFIRKRTEEIAQAFNKEHSFMRHHTSRSTTVSHIQWTPPPERWYKLNVDGASKGNPGAAGAGGIIRDQFGNWITGFTLNLGYCTSVKAELAALLQGLKLAKSHGITKLIVHTDSQVVCNKLKKQHPKNKGYCFLVKQSQELLNLSDWDVKVEHCYRESNQAADLLANMGLAQSTASVILTGPPSSLRRILALDNSCVAWPRNFKI